MRNIVYKYKMHLGPNEFALPMGATAMHFQVDPKIDMACMWIAHPLVEHGTQMALYRFNVIPTGVEYDPETWTPLFSMIDGIGMVWHLFGERIPGSGKTQQYTERSNHASHQ